MYSAQITRQHKGAILLLLDLSGSMAERVVFEGRSMTKSQALAEAVNSLIQECINRSRRERSTADYFDIGIVGYAADEATSLLKNSWQSIVALDNTPTPTQSLRLRRTLPDGRSVETIVERRCWIEPEAKGRTPMGKAFQLARRMCQSWCCKHPDSFPPIVINITDGEATDATAEEIGALAQSLRSLSTNDGNLLLMNIHLASEHDTPTEPLRFPNEGTPLPNNRHAQLLYNISSPLPELYNAAIEELTHTPPPYRAICYNASLDELVGLLAIGSLSMDRII
ncbi:MAG: VWA domain-containing protein [Tidjanibacter sp.]|nr:VWA domain-containing protein [Tidjanibacter sp.]